MAATFDPTLPTALDRVRFAVADIDLPANPLRPDEQYEAVLALAGQGEALATALMAESLAAQFAQSPDAYGESGGISVRWSERVKTWLALAASLREGLAATAGAEGAVSAAMVRVPAGGFPSEYVRGPLVPVLRGHGLTWSGTGEWWP